jgi:hypothetical protein
MILPFPLLAVQEHLPSFISLLAETFATFASIKTSTTCRTNASYRQNMTQATPGVAHDTSLILLFPLFSRFSHRRSTCYYGYRNLQEKQKRQTST